MTKTKADATLPNHFVSLKERRQRQKMDSGQGNDDICQQTQPPPPTFQEQPTSQPPQTSGKKKVNRAPSPARPKDVPGWSLAKIRSGSGSGTPTLSVKTGGIHLGSRISRRCPGSGKELKPEKSRQPGKSTPSVSGSHKSGNKSAKSARRKISDASTASDDLSKDSGCAPGKLSPSDSSSELSDCASEGNKLSTDALSSDTETSSRGGGADGEKPGTGQANGISDKANRGDQTGKNPLDKDRLSLGVETGEESISPGDERSVGSFDSRLHVSTSLAFSDLTEEFMDGMQEEFVREIEELRSENDYLKDEIEELRSEMLEMRDVYMEEDVYQLQELRQQLDQADKTCRILQYRLRKAERRSLRVAQTGQVDGELIRVLEQDVKVAKDVSIRLHNELDAVEKKRSRLEQENEDLRQKLLDLEVAKQVLQAEMDKVKENSLKKRGARLANKTDKKPSPQEDSADLKCQLHFAKEESALMCKKLTKMAKDNDSMKEELVKYRSLYGDLDSTLSVEEVADSPHTREAELKVHLKLVEEEANLLSRRIVELEVENRGLRAEMDEMKSQELPGHLVTATSSYGDSRESMVELKRHLQFVEEEADLLRRSLLEMEEQNKLLMNELNKYKSEHDLDATMSEDSCSVMSEPSQEELLNAKLQIGELSGKVKKLQYENRVLLSNLQRCDLASYQSTRLSMETDAEAGDSAECVPSQIRREGPIGGENDSREDQEKLIRRNSHIDNYDGSEFFKSKDYDALLRIKEQAGLVSKAIDLMILDSNGFSSYPKICPSIDTPEQALNESLDKSEASSDLKLVSALNNRLSALQRELATFMDKVEHLGYSSREQIEGASPLPLLSESGSFLATMPSVSQDCTTEGPNKGIGTDQKQPPDFRDQMEWPAGGQSRDLLEAHLSGAEDNENRDSNKDLENYTPDDKESDIIKHAAKIRELQSLLSEAKEGIRGFQEQLSQEQEAHRQETESCSQKLAQLKEEHQKALIRRDFELQSLNLQTRLQQKFWSQERNLMIQESQQLKQNLLLLNLKLRWFLKQWRLGKKLDSEGKDILEVNSVKDLYMLIEEEGLTAHQLDNKTEDQSQSPTARADNLSEKNYKQSSGLDGALADLKEALRDLSTELQEERRGSEELTQQFAKAKAAWEVERSELKCHITQLECKAGKPGLDKELPDLKAALKKEREEHQHLLADSYAAVMDLTKQLQISEKNWSREKVELLERFNQERGQWEQRLRDAQSKISQTLHDKMSEKDTSPDAEAQGTNLQRTKSVSSISEFESLLDSSPFVPSQDNSDASKGRGIQPSAQPISNNLSHLGELNKKNWKYLTNEMALYEKADPFKTWDCPTMTNSFAGLDLTQSCIQRSYTAPDKTGIRIYYSPPVVRRMEGSLAKEKQEEKTMAEPGYLFTTTKPRERGESENPSDNTFNRWLCNFSKQHRDLLENNSKAATTAGLPSPFHNLEISGNLSDDMKEMTNCVRQAIRSSSLERKCKDTASQTVVVTSTGTQTAQFVSIGLQTEGPRTGLHAKSWSPRSSSLMSARSRQISTSLEKVHSRIERPCCSPKYGSPKLQRKVSTSSSKLDTSKDRSLWNLHHRGQNGSAWARSTTTRDSPVLSGLNDGLSSLFSVVEHNGSTESLWKGIPQESKPKAEVPKYGIVHEFFRNVCGRVQTPMPVAERQPKDGTLEDGAKKPDSPAATVGSASPDNVSKIVNKRFLKQSLRDEQAQGNKDTAARDTNMSSSALEDAACDCTSQSLTSCFARPSRSAARHSLAQCKMRSPEAGAAEEKGDAPE
ncbi:microtubule cross-linking factor 2 isoform X1 [Lepisosteus oculatus]|uniref:microtubule cross-linking factor 2 isoform X1 n=1 Tax=Lepisosteus oculatus TaxID=7918 RepID=UPI0035F522A6